MRMSYQRQKEVLEMPNLIEVQKDSYDWFLRSGLKEVFDDISPISDYGGRLSLEFVDFTLCEDDVKYSIEECKQRDATYAAPLKVKVRLYNKEKDEITEHEIFMGDLPLMTATGTFVINGAERVIVSQLVRSPGIYYGIAHDKLGKRLFSCTVIPNRGAWLEYETDSNDVFYVRVDRTRKVPITVLIRALGVSSNAEIVELFGEEPKILASFTKDTSTNYQEGLLELYKKIRPGEPLAVENAESLIMSMFFDPRRYDLAKVGRYKFNKKLALRSRIRNQILAEDVVDPSTGEILAEKGTTVTLELADKIQNAAVPYVWIQTEERNVKVLSNLMVDLKAWVDVDEEELGINEKVYYPVLEKILEENTDIEEIKQAIKRDIHDLIPKHITKEDIFASINYNMHLEYGAGNADDIDHLGNRRIRAVGELLQNQYRIGLSRYSVKRGCETSNCGLCTVFLEGKPVLSCSVLAARANGCKVDTLEGLQEEAEEFGSFIAGQGAEQCGFCNPGMIMNAIALFRENPDPSEEEIKEYLAGNLCRCSGYEGQLRGILNFLAWKKQQGGAS